MCTITSMKECLATVNFMVEKSRSAAISNGQHNLRPIITHLSTVHAFNVPEIRCFICCLLSTKTYTRRSMNEEADAKIQLPFFGLLLLLLRRTLCIVVEICVQQRALLMCNNDFPPFFIRISRSRKLQIGRKSSCDWYFRGYTHTNECEKNTVIPCSIGKHEMSIAKSILLTL